ncbi:MAG: (Fe-S)-binding protein [Candidatus Jordarchaeales archaeon]
MEDLLALKKELFRCIHCKACMFSYSGEPDREGIGEYKGTLYEGMIEGCPSGSYYKLWEGYLNSGRMWIIRSMLEGSLVPSESVRDLIYPCTTCGNCQAQCENKLPTVELIEAARAACVEAGIPLLPKTAALGKNISQVNNPYAEKHEDRTKWLEGTKVKPKKDAKVAYFVGCTASYREKQVAKATAELLNKLGIEFAVLEDEVCCGSPLFRTGQRSEAKRVMNENLKTFKDYDTLVFSCAGCYRTFKVDYPKYSKSKLPFTPKHTIELVADLIGQGKIKFKGSYNKKVTWHDPCHLMRHIALDLEREELAKSTNWFLDEREIKRKKEEWYEIPRKILKAIPGLQLVEMYRIKEDAWCCGAGGGVKTQFPDLALWTGIERVKEAEATGAQAIVTSCPFCVRNLRDAVNASGSKIEVVELLELLNQLV